ncbi:alpha/beta hydrolase [Paenibacillus sp. PR3]|uniref:Alpha/beta hydrolase n=1 Tax=Paenibacillus terricola TaxID=2763503 RepID=A0ABR8MTM5_9BACL|nr:alpha/beta hydrolase [Paenibacillus terricola]MBD3919313.1 alpha/beta hydrolase [Paenibacillus terricola]
MPYVQINDMEMFYEKMGASEALIFLHSHYSRGILAFASQMLDFQQQYSCYFPDFRGHGRTRCSNLEWSTPGHANDIIAFMDQLGIDKAHIVGYSSGANVGLYIAVNHSNRVASLTTIGTGGTCEPDGVEQFEPEWLLVHHRQDTINQMIERHEEAHRGDWQQFMRQSAQDWRLYPQLTEEQLRTISCPSLFITGEHDPYAGEEKVRWLSSLVAGSMYDVVPGGSHRPHMTREYPVLVNDTILRFLASVGQVK